MPRTTASSSTAASTTAPRRPSRSSRRSATTAAGRRRSTTAASASLLGNSAWDARPYLVHRAADRRSRTTTTSSSSARSAGRSDSRPVRNRGRTVFVGYQRTTDHNATTQSALMPTLLERAGDFSQTRRRVRASRFTVVDPLTGLPFAGNVIPRDRISPQAAALLGYYPLPNVERHGGFNYQTPIVPATRQDSVQSRLTQTAQRRGISSSARSPISGRRPTRRTCSASSMRTQSRGLDAAVNWSHRFSQFLSLRLALSVHAADRRRDAVLRQPHERVGRRRHHRQQPGRRSTGDRRR